MTWWQDPPANSGTSLVVLDAVDDEEVRQLFNLSRRHTASFYSIMTKPPQIDTFPDRNLRRISKYYWRRVAAHLRGPSSKRSKWLNQFPSFGAFVDKMSAEAALIVTGRLHAVCIALDLEIPILAVPSNTHKIEGLLIDAGLENRVVRSVREIESRLLEQTLTSFAYSDEEIRRIRAYRNKTLDEARRMFGEITNGSRYSDINHYLVENGANLQQPILTSDLAPMSSCGAYE